MLSERKQVLLVEDDRDQAHIIETWLTRKSNYQVTTAFDVNTGQNLAVSGDFDALVSDVWLPGGNGLSVVRAYKEQYRERPALVITASRTVDAAVEALRASADDILLKPLNLRFLASKVDHLISQSRDLDGQRRPTVLAIGAHPDDVEIGCGGTLLSHAAQGHRVVIATLSHGAGGGCASTREQEARLAAERIGAQLYLANLPDMRITEGPETIDTLSQIIRTEQPTIVYTHSGCDLHQDHRAVHRATMVAARGVTNVLCYQSPSTTPDFHPTFFVPVSSFLDDKVELLSAYGSQTSVRPYLVESIIRASAAYWGRFAGYVDVEPFMVIRQSAVA